MVILSHFSISHINSMTACLSLRISHLILRLTVYVNILSCILPIINVVKWLLLFNHFSILMHSCIRELYFTFVEGLYLVLVHSVFTSFHLFLEVLLSTHLIIFFFLLPVLLLIGLLVLILNILVLILRFIVVNLLLFILISVFIIIIASSHGMSSLISLGVHVVSLLVSEVNIAFLVFVIVDKLRLVKIHFLLIWYLFKWMLLIQFILV